MYFKITSFILFFLVFIFFIDLTITTEKKELEIISLRIDVKSSRGGNPSKAPILKIYNRRLRISWDAFHNISGSKYIFLEITPILDLPKKLYINPRNKFYSYNYIITIILILLHGGFLILARKLRIKRFIRVMEANNTVLPFVYIWLLYY